jgi:hypothetical protein
VITEPDVTLTDYGLAIEGAVFAYLLHRHEARETPVHGWFVCFFGAGSLAALAGGTVHGFFLGERSRGAVALWATTLLAIGLSALAAWAIGASLRFSPVVARWIVIAAAVEFLLYAAVLVLTQAFAVAILNYLPAAVFLLVVFVLKYRRLRSRDMLAAVVGLVLTFVAAGVQLGGLALHPAYFNHNALYHAVQAAALFLLFVGARGVVGVRG